MELLELRLHLLGCLPVALAALRQAVEPERLPPCDRDGVVVARLPLVRAVDRSGDDRDPLLQRDHRRTGLNLARHSRELAHPLDEEPERTAFADGLAHLPDRVPVRLAA